MRYTPEEVARLLGARALALRLARDWKRSTLAARAGVSAASIKRFETAGQIGLENLLLIAQALDRLTEFERLLEPPPARSIAELDEAEAPPRRRGRR